MSSHQFFSSSLHPSSEQPRPALSMAQEEARTATVNLPPRVRGARRGIIQIQVEEVVWFANSKDFSVRRPPTPLDQGTTLVRLRWWGEQGEGLVWKPVCARMDTDGNLTYASNAAEQKSRARASVLSHGTSSAEHEAITLNESSPVAYPVVVSPNTFTNYLNDAQWLVFEIYHFQETDPAAIHREFLKQIHRTAHANRALPQAKAPLGHIMFDLAPLTESISYGELEFTSSKNLPILVNGTPIGQVSVKVQSELSATLALGEAPRPDQAYLSQQPLQGSNLGSQSQALNDSFARSGLNASPFGASINGAGVNAAAASPTASPQLSASHHAGFNSQQLPRSSGAPAASHHHATNDPFDISHLIAQSDEMSKHIAESVLGQPMNVEAYIQEKNKQREQQQHDDGNAANVNQLHHGNAFDEIPVGQRANGEPKFDPSAPYSHMAGLSNPHAASGSTHGRSFGTTAVSSTAAPIAHAAPHLATSHRPFAQGPAFADFTPAPAHLFPHLLPQLPAVLNIPPPFPQVSPEFGMPLSVKHDPDSFLDEGNLITLNLRIRKVQLAKSQSELLVSASSLGGRAQQPNLNHIANHVTIAGDTTAGVSELIQQAKKHHAQEKRNAAGGRDGFDSDGGKNQFLVLHYHFFTDLLMGRSPALFSTKYDLSHPGYFHFSESTPRVFSKSFLSSLQNREVPLELFAYKRKPSWKDKKDRDTGKYVPQQPYQVQLARAQIPLAFLLTLPYRLPSANTSSQSWLLRFLQSHIGLNTSLPLLDPLNPSPEIIGSVEVCLSWGTANDIALLTQMEKHAIQVQKIVRGFLSRRRIRRFRIAQALEEEENLADDDAHTVQNATQRTHVSNVVGLDHSSHPLSPGTTRTISFPLNLPPASPLSPSAQAPAAPMSSPVPPSYPQSIRRSASPSPQSSPRRSESAVSSRSPRPSYHHLAQPHPLKDMATSPINSPSTTRPQPRFHLNLPTQHYSTANSVQVSSRKEATTQQNGAPQQTQLTGSGSSRHARASSSPAPSFHSTPSPSPFFPVDHFVPAPRVEDKADFISYSFQSKTAGIPSSIVPPPTIVSKIGTPGTDKAQRVRSFQETLLAIQKAREEVAAAQALAFPSKPLVQQTPTSSPMKLVRVGSETKPHYLQQEQKEKIEAEEDEDASVTASHPITKVTFDEENKYASPQRISRAQGQNITSPPKASSASKSQQPAAAILSPLSKRLAEAALEDELLRVEELSDVDVDEYEDDVFEKESPVIVPNGSSAPSSSLSHLSLLPPSFDNPLDASVARQKLSQQMRELDELQRRMEWRLSGKPIEEFEKQQQQHHAQSRIQSPLKTSSSVASSASPAAPREAVPASKGTPREFTSPSKSTSQSIHPSPGVQSHQASPLHHGSTPVVVSVINVDNTNFRSARSQQPLTPETPAAFLSPSPRSGPNSSAPAPHLSSLLSPLKSDRFDALDALPVSPKPASSLAAAESPRRPLSAKAPSPSHATAASATLPHAPSSHRAHHVESEHESESDVSVSDTESDFDDDLLDDSDQQEEEDRESHPEPSSGSASKSGARQWGLQFQANQVDVSVRYEAGLLASEAASRARQQIAEQAAARERLFPAGLKSESSSSAPIGSSSASNHHSVEPGSARYESYQRALASGGANSFLSKFTPEELQRLERAARIMAEEEHD